MWQVRSIGEECLTESELRALILKKVQTDKGKFNLYDGFEPSGRMHCAQGVFKAMNVNKATSSGGTFIFWVADWFALMNDKMGGDLEKIKVVGKYLIEVWTAAGMDMSDNKVVFKWASDEITNNAGTYWPKMLDIARRFSIARIKKCCQIMGRLEGNLSCSQVLYPIMQCTDVFFLKADVCQLGVDQRKVNMLAREYCDLAKIKFKPVILSHHMLYGLAEGQEKMSKSNPDSAIFMEDTVEDVARKITNAYCPIKPSEKKKEASDDAGKESMQLIVDDLKNPCLDYVKYIVFGPPNSTFPTKAKTYTEFESVKTDFLAGALSENDLKDSLIDAINFLLEPVRQHFSTNAVAKDLLAKVQEYKSIDKSAIDRQFRRLDAVEKGVAPADSHLVLVPAPTNNPTLQIAVDLLQQIKQGGGKKVVLFMQDWSATVLSACDAEVKLVNAYFDVVVKSLNVLDAAAMMNVTVVKQSDCVMADPSNYWISVINVGRFFNLNEVQAGYDDEQRVGNVIARMMLCADVVALSPASVACIGESVDLGIVTKYFKNAEIPLPVPSVVSCEQTLVRLQDVDAVHATDNSEYFLMDDPKVHGKTKLKKSFCEPGNVEFCPSIQIVRAFVISNGGSLEIKRSAENGGDVVYSDVRAIEADFLGGALHPGDLKAAVGDIVVKLFTDLAAACKKDKAWTQCVKALKADIKKQSKKK